MQEAPLKTWFQEDKDLKYQVSSFFISHGHSSIIKPSGIFQICFLKIYLIVCYYFALSWVALGRKAFIFLSTQMH